MYNIWKSRDIHDPELFKKLQGNIWEFRTKYLTKQIRLLAFWDKTEKKEKHLTQEQLGKLVGVQKAQISKIENNAKDLRLSTILKVFNALKATVKITIDFDPNTHLEIA